MSQTALVINASVQSESSISKTLVGELVAHLKQKGEVSETIDRDLGTEQVELITESHVGAYYTAPADRSDEQKRVLEASDTYLSELKSVNTLIIGSPMYNFSVPASLKAWIDLICRVGESFRYTENGPEGLLNIDKAYIVVATGGVPVGSPVDFLTPYLKQIMSFIGVKEVAFISADGLNSQKDASLLAAREQLKAA